MNFGVKPILSRSRCRKLATHRAGFHGWRASCQLEIERRFTPLISETMALRFAVSQVHCAKDLIKLPEIQGALLTAAGVSHKAANHLSNPDKREVVSGLVKNSLEPTGAKFVEELVFRYLLARRDTLSSSLCNVGGFMAQKKLTRAILACLKLAGKKCHWLRADTKAWTELPDDETDVELSLRGLSWVAAKGPRTLLYNVTVPLVKNNVDLSLFKCSSGEMSRKIIHTPSAYIALGELKGGIDPAGADEHWKTARTALNRIHEAFTKQKLKPHTFFIGAAIEAKMAGEIWEMLKQGSLENAANLTDENHIASITSWICTL